MTDRSTKLLLAAIALGLWANAIGNWFQPVTVDAQSERFLRSIRSSVQDIESDVNRISNGRCRNSRIC